MKVYTSVDDITHYLDERTGLPSMDLLPGPAFRRAAFLIAIIEAVTAGWNEIVGMPLPTVVRCRQRPGRRPCAGSIDAACSEEHPDHIVWTCPICTDHGYIHGYRGSAFDLSTMTGSGWPRGTDEVELDLSVLEFEAVRRVARLGAVATRVVKGARGLMGGVALVAPQAWMDKLLDVVALAACSSKGEERQWLQQVLAKPVIAIDDTLAEDGDVTWH